MNVCVVYAQREEARCQKGHLLFQEVQRSGEFLRYLPMLMVARLSVKIGVSSSIPVSREPSALTHTPVWMLSDCASAPPDSAP